MEELRETSCDAFVPGRYSLWRIRRLSLFRLRRKGYQHLENLNTSSECEDEPLAKTLRKCASVQEYRYSDSDTDAVEKVIEESSPRGVLEGLDIVALRCPESDTSSSRGSTSCFDVQEHQSKSPWRVLLQRWRPKSIKRLYSYPRFGIPKLLRGTFSKVYRFQRTESSPGSPGKPTWKNFSFAELQAATDNFSSENIIGKGGYAVVYKGCLEDGQFVAVKRLIHGTSDEDTTSFLSELGIIVHLEHPNATKLVGFGIEGGLFLVLQLSEHGSLSSFLHGTNQKLGWSSRYRIAIGTAEGLEYLHERCPRRIIHRDIKASNILLSENFEPQISDFGLAKWLPDKLTHYTMSSFEGTFGYLAPEYLMHGIVNEKVDVFAYGVLLLELITGRKAIDSSKQSLVIWAKPLLERKNIRELVDPSLGDAYDSAELNRVTNTAYLCIQQSSILRPRMSQARMGKKF
ncbi:receptor-like cytosolic serine/threonine-protein kinase RBK2 [Iris pallida]|uniref:non-specific serine/threonine protein kinase n=1 Tax=Iris pallida TaxID=29817 RepID=A0AAX6FYF5_IRIPA|nr:receptor-like cytosolic serine/threonine-protein kinase RBK2 [Iris pallida]KAJ6821456.1 receptor-like cytosolic serine/threonine-protein kinase RBK2 [Iris pallida]